MKKIQRFLGILVKEYGQENVCIRQMTAISSSEEAKIIEKYSFLSSKTTKILVDVLLNTLIHITLHLNNNYSLYSLKITKDIEKENFFV